MEKIIANKSMKRPLKALKVPHLNYVGTYNHHSNRVVRSKLVISPGLSRAVSILVNTASMNQLWFQFTIGWFFIDVEILFEVCSDPISPLLVAPGYNGS